MARGMTALAAALLLFTARPAASEGPEGDAVSRFVSIVLGAAGGLTEGDLSAYLLAPVGSTAFACLDAGTLLTGIRRSREMGSFADLEIPPIAGPDGWILRHHVGAYLISHAHLDHLAGLILNAPEDTPKRIYGLAFTVDAIRDHLFNWRVWPNFADDGAEPRLRNYRYVRLQPGREEPLVGTALSVEAHPLSHAGARSSTAFLLRAGTWRALYVGDVGPDAVERSDGLETLWARIAPRIRDGTLRGMFLEASYPDGRPDEELHGHLTPSWMMRELRRLAKRVDPAHPELALRDLTVIVSHIKPSLEPGASPREQIERQLDAHNDLGVRLVVPRQGQRIEF